MSVRLKCSMSDLVQKDLPYGTNKPKTAFHYKCSRSVTQCQYLYLLTVSNVHIFSQIEAGIAYMLKAFSFFFSIYTPEV